MITVTLAIFCLVVAIVLYAATLPAPRNWVAVGFACAAALIMLLVALRVLPAG